MSPILIPILALMIPIVAIIGKTFVKPWLDHRERALEVEANKLAEKAAQYAACLLYTSPSPRDRG